MKNVIFPSLMLTMLGLAFLTACTAPKAEDQQEAEPEAVTISLEEGRQLAQAAQAELLANVGAAMQAGGPTNAVDFCNIHASGIMDSLSASMKATIARVSDKNRNPGNKASAEEEALMAFFAEHKDQQDTLLGDTYYKPIFLGMPTCLQCHGSEEADIAAETLALIQERYPEDLARGYALGDIRGMWKIRR